MTKKLRPLIITKKNRPVDPEFEAILEESLKLYDASRDYVTLEDLRKYLEQRNRTNSETKPKKDNEK